MKEQIQLTITITLQAHEILKRLHMIGLYGVTVEEVAQRLLCEQLRAFVQVRR